MDETRRTIEELRKLFRDVLLELKGKNPSQFSLHNKTIAILKEVENDALQQALILEKFDIKLKPQKKLHSIQIALIFNKIRYLRVLLNRIDQREYLGNYELLDQAIMSHDDDQLAEVLKIYTEYGIQINLARICDLAQTCLYEKSWNQDIIKALYPYTRACFIPREQKKAKMFALVCYNTFNIETATHKRRDGAKEEADCIIKGFRDGGFTVRAPLTDWTFDELLAHLGAIIEEIKENCSIVVISLMSHGDQGVIFDRNGNAGEINEVLKVLFALNNILPVIVLIQACQGDRVPWQQVDVKYRSLDAGDFSDGEVPDSQGHEADSPGPHLQLVAPHITVLRPNTMVVTATTEYTVAKRDVFLRHFAKELENADGMTTINTMVQLSSRAMSLHHDEDSRKQAPTTYHLLRKPVVLPRSAALDRKRVQYPQQQSDKKDILKELIEEYPLDINDINLLFDLNDQYIIPYRQDHMKRYGLVLFNAEGRENAVDEASEMENGLFTAGFETIKIKWESTKELRHKINELPSKEMSLLVISIMTHGRAGMLVGSNGSHIPITDILQILRNKMPPRVPLIVIIQACQHYSLPQAAAPTSYEDAEEANSNETSYIVLNRPHTLLLMSTVAGATSVRGAFTGAMARQFSKADGKTTINDMVTNAVIDVKKSEVDGYDQSPESRTTLQKHLVFPNVAAAYTGPQQRQVLRLKESLLAKLMSQ